MRLFSAFVFLFSLPSLAEYRVFRLEIKGADGNLRREFLSTLDPDQYRGYHPLQTGETISYTATWMCRERTNEQAPCPNPKDTPKEASAPSP